MNKDAILGYIESDDKKYDFVFDNYQLVFVGYDYNNFLFGDEEKIEPDVNGFVHGYAFNKERISIYVGKEPLEIRKKINTWLYIDDVSNTGGDSFDSYNAIEFIGGSINGLWKNYGLVLEDDNRIEIKYNRVVYPINIENENCEIHEFSTVRKSFKDHKKSISDNDPTLKIVFSNSKNLGDFEKQYTIIEHLVSFLTFRRNAGFDEVVLGRQLEDDFFQPLGKCYINLRHEIITRNTHRCITLDMLDGERTRNLFDIIQEKAGLPIECIPKNRDDFGWIDKDKVRDICTALEIEIDKQEICGTTYAQINELMAAVKEIVKKYRKTHQEISQRTYESIFGSIRHWSNSLYDRIVAAVSRYKNEIEAFTKYYDMNLCDDDIDEFVKYRNGITHTKGKVLSSRIADTALTLTALLYFMILHRIGFKEDEIINLIDMGFMSHMDE